ncbi:MAG: helix-turn-helix domain-containing protein [Chitinophagales bacterium]
MSSSAIPIEVFFCWIGSFCGVLTGMVLLFAKGNKIIANRYLGYFFLIFSFAIFVGSFAFNDLFLRFPHLFRLDSPFTYAIMPMLYLFVRSSIDPGFRLRKWNWLLFLPALLNLVEFLPLYFSSREAKLAMIQVYATKGSYLLPLHFPAKTIWTGLLIGIDLSLIYKYYKSDTATFQKFAAFYRWMAWFHLYFILLVLFQFSLMLGLYFETWNPYFISYFSQSAFVLINSIALFFYPDILYGMLPVQKRNKPVVSKIPAPQDDLFDRQVLIWREKKIFLNPKLTLIELAKESDMNARQLSQVIRNQSGYEVRDFINQQRVIYIKEVFAGQPEKIQSITIAALAEEAGFNSRAAFYNAFKKFTGTTPKDYMKQLNPKLTINEELRMEN